MLEENRFSGRDLLEIQKYRTEQSRLSLQAIWLLMLQQRQVKFYLTLPKREYFIGGSTQTRKIKKKLIFISCMKQRIQNFIEEIIVDC